jgi:hypothetical protein
MGAQPGQCQALCQRPHVLHESADDPEDGARVLLHHGRRRGKAVEIGPRSPQQPSESRLRNRHARRHLGLDARPHGEHRRLQRRRDRPLRREILDEEGREAEHVLGQRCFRVRGLAARDAGPQEGGGEAHLRIP